MSTWLAGVSEQLSRATGVAFDLGFVAPLLQATLLLAFGWLAARTARRVTERAWRGPTSQTRLLAQRTVFWTIFGLFAVSALRTLGFDFTVILGAAGILTAAVAFASQTSASNLISGLFLGLERSIEIGDVITVEGVTGEVLSIDLLSTRLRTFDNLMIRMPNETMVKTRITNLNRFPIRRYDLQVGVAYDSDLAHVRRVLFDVADRDPLILEEPAPLLIAQGFGPSSIDLQVSVWCSRTNLLDVRNRLQERIHVAFAREGIEIPLPKLDLSGRVRGASAPAPATDEGPAEAEPEPDDAASHAGEDDASNAAESRADRA